MLPVCLLLLYENYESVNMFCFLLLKLDISNPNSKITKTKIDNDYKKKKI